MGQQKLKRFAEFSVMNNCFDFPFHLKGKWQTQVFKNQNPLILELACGKGEYTVNLSQQDLNTNFIGIDIKSNRMWKGAKIAQAENLQNSAFVRMTVQKLNEVFEKNERTLAIASSAAAFRNTSFGSSFWVAAICAASSSLGLMTPICTSCMRKNSRMSLRPSPSMFISTAACKIFCACGSLVTAIIEVSARTVAARLLLDDGPTSTATSNSASLRSFSYSISPSSPIIGRMSSTESISARWPMRFIFRPGST